MLKGIIFDMDGVLFDTERLYNEMDFVVAKEMGFALTQETINSQIGTNSAVVRAVFSKAMGPSHSYDTFHNSVTTRCNKIIEDNGIPLKPGIVQVLQWLREGGYKIAVASSSVLPVIERYLNGAGVAEYFDTLISGDMVEASKPAPDIFLAAAKAMGLAPAQCVAVEDSHNGIRSAACAGCVTIMIPDILPATEEMREKSAAVLCSLHDIIPFMQGYNCASNEKIK